jgi:hypothetical protein
VSSVDVAPEIKAASDLPDIAPRIVVNGFPKAGTHLALILVAVLAEPWQEDNDGRIYHFGTFRHGSWSHEWMNPWNSCQMALYQPAKTWIIGHAGWFPALQRAYERRGSCKVFIYRDLRDVAVSMVYHIENTDENKDWRHSERDLYMAMPDREARLLAIINGVGHDPGLVKRWERYAPWLDVDWVHAIKFEDVITNHARMAEEALQYCILRTAEASGVPATLRFEDYIRMVDKTVAMLSKPKDHSSTYRKGKAGGWREEFTPAVHDAFDAAGGNEWLDKMGYEV